MDKNRNLPIEAEDDILPEDIKPDIKRSIKLFETNVWKEAPELQNGVVLTSYIEQLHNEGYEPDQIASIVHLPVKTIKRKLNSIVNSFLGTPTVESKDLRRLEVDEYILKQINEIETEMTSYLEILKGQGVPPAMKDMTKYHQQLNKLLETRMKLWHLEDKTSEGGPSRRTGVIGTVTSRIDSNTKAKIADFIIGIVDKN